MADDLRATYLTDGSLSAADITLAQAQHLAMQGGGKALRRRASPTNSPCIRQQAMGVNHKKCGCKKEGSNSKPCFRRCTDEIPERIRTVYRPVANEWRNNIELQLYIDYWEAA